MDKRTRKAGHQVVMDHECLCGECEHWCSGDAEYAYCSIFCEVVFKLDYCRYAKKKSE